MIYRMRVRVYRLFIVEYLRRERTFFDQLIEKSRYLHDSFINAKVICTNFSKPLSLFSIFGYDFIVSVDQFRLTVISIENKYLIFLYLFYCIMCIN